MSEDQEREPKQDREPDQEPDQEPDREADVAQDREPGQAPDQVQDKLYERLRVFEGLPAAEGGTGPDPVNSAMIRHWCEALGHPAAADGSAPETMLQVWTMGGLRGNTSRSAAWAELLSLVEGEGFTSVVATDCEQEYARLLRPGDVVTFDSVIESVSRRKTTRLGTGYFLTTRTVVRAGGAVAGTHRFRIFKYAPRERAAGRTGATRPQPVINRDNAGYWEGVKQKELLIQRCTACGRLRFPWLPGCNGCGSGAWETVPASGAGTVYSYVVMHHPPFPAFDPPYAVALVELTEGVRVVSSVVGVPYDEVRIGMPVRLEFAEVGEGVVLPVFRAEVARPAAEQPAPGGPPPLPQSPKALPHLRIPVTRTLIVSGALASRDFQDVHHDAQAAQDRGSPDVFMNILTTNGLVARYVKDRLGPDTVLRSVKIRLGVPNYPGDELLLTGTLLPPAPDAPTPGTTTTSHPLTELRITGTNSLGTHVTATVTAIAAATPAPAQEPPA